MPDSLREYLCAVPRVLNAKIPDETRRSTMRNVCDFLEIGLLKCCFQMQQLCRTTCNHSARSWHVLATHILQRWRCKAFRIPELSRRWQRQPSGLHRKGGLLDRRNPHPHCQVQLCLGVDDVVWRDRDRLGCCARASRVSEAEDGYQGHGVHVVAIRQVGRRVGRAVRRRKTLFLD